MISERSGKSTKQPSLHILPPRANRFLSADIIKGTSTCSVAANSSNPFPTLLCFSPPTRPLLPPLVVRALTCEQEESKEYGDGQEGASDNWRGSRVAVFLSGGWFISEQREEAHRLLYETNSASDADEYILVLVCIWLSDQLDLYQVHK